ncbi:hypothetical protein GGS21DRAFT_530584 [Xylaria nigripes]|nr:hypothetical protein GGS21DRAFT_530584 [Xylaria nigripes]
MGLLNFIGKKSPSDLKSPLDLKACGYDTAVASAPPIRGKKPVPGNGAKILEQFQKAHPGVSTVSTMPSQPCPPVDHNSDVERPMSAPSRRHDEPEKTSALRSQHTIDSPSPSKNKYGSYRPPGRELPGLQTSLVTAKPVTFTASPSAYSASICSADTYLDYLESHPKYGTSNFYDPVHTPRLESHGQDFTKNQNSPTNHTEWRRRSSEIFRYADYQPRNVLPQLPDIRNSIGLGLDSVCTGLAADMFPQRTSSLPYDANANNHGPDSVSRPSSVHSLMSDSSSETSHSLAAQQADHRPPQSHDDFINKPLPSPPSPMMDSFRQKTVSSGSAMASKVLSTSRSFQAMRFDDYDISENTYQQKTPTWADKSPRSGKSVRRQSTTDVKKPCYKVPENQRILTSRAMCTDDENDSAHSSHVQIQSIAQFNRSKPPHDVEEPASNLHTLSPTYETAMSSMSPKLLHPQPRPASTTFFNGSPLFPQINPDMSFSPVPEVSLPLTPQSMSDKSPARTPSSTPHTTAQRRLSADFFLEDYASDDQASPPPSRGSCEKALLFLDTGYGKSGTQSPGLPGLFDVRRALGAKAPPNRAPQAEAHKGGGLLRMPAYFEADSDDDDEDALNERNSSDSFDQERNPDVPVSRLVSVPRHVRGQERFLAK